MVRLVTSRLHRCYSRRGLSRSAAIEKLTGVFHLVASVGMAMQNDWGLHFMVSPSASPIPSLVRTGSIALLLFVHSTDFLSSVNAHVKFYTKPKSTSKRAGLPTPTPSSSPLSKRYTGIHNDNSSPSSSSGAAPGTTASASASANAGAVSSPAVHDMLVSMLYVLGSGVLMLSAWDYHRYYSRHPGVEPPPSAAQELARGVQVRCTMFFTAMSMAGVIMNSLLCLPYPVPFPSQSIVSAWLARWHMLVATTFAVATVMKFMALQTISHSMLDPHRDTVRFVTTTTQTADALAITAATLNLVRIAIFHARTGFWAQHEAKRTGQLRNPRSNNTNTSWLARWLRPFRQPHPTDDHDSDYANEYDTPLDLDDDVLKSGPKRSAP